MGAPARTFNDGKMRSNGSPHACHGGPQRFLEATFRVDRAYGRPGVLRSAFQGPSTLNRHGIGSACLTPRHIPLEGGFDRRVEFEDQPWGRELPVDAPVPLHEPALEALTLPRDSEIVEGAAVEPGGIRRRAAIRNDDRS